MSYASVHIEPVTHRLDLDGQTLTYDIYDGPSDGAVVVLLHGFPQTRRAWRHVAPALAASGHTVICPDLPGYGDSTSPADADDVARFSKRATAEVLVAAVRDLGHERFAVVGHDRGGLVALRAALDHPRHVSHLGVLDVLPTPDNWQALSGASGVFAWHLFFLAGPAGLPERLIGADPETFFGHFFQTWTRIPGAIDTPTREHYVNACGTPSAIHAICQDYRAGATVDLADDAADLRAGRVVQAPTLALWQDPGDTPLPFDPEAVWKSWTITLTTAALPCGHFLPEEQPERVTAAVTHLLATS